MTQTPIPDDTVRTGILTVLSRTEDWIEEVLPTKADPIIGISLHVGAISIGEAPTLSAVFEAYPEVLAIFDAAIAEQKATPGTIVVAVDVGDGSVQFCLYTTRAQYALNIDAEAIAAVNVSGTIEA